MAFGVFTRLARPLRNGWPGCALETPLPKPSLMSNRRHPHRINPFQERLIVLQAISPYWSSNAMCVHVERVLADLKRMRTASPPAEHKRSTV